MPMSALILLQKDRIILHRAMNLSQAVWAIRHQAATHLHLVPIIPQMLRAASLWAMPILPAALTLPYSASRAWRADMAVLRQAISSPRATHIHLPSVTTQIPADTHL